MDIIFGFPLDIARYAILLNYICRYTNFKPGSVIMPGANVHLYLKNLDGALEMRNRVFNDDPTIFIGADPNVVDSYTLTQYNPHPPIEMNVAK